MNNVREILSFWFQDTRPRQWFARDSAFDALLRDRFFTPTRAAIAGDLEGWGAEPSSGLALPLFEQYTDARTATVARRHRDVIARFGRFPHRNKALGRVSTADELAFLQTPGSRF